MKFSRAIRHLNMKDVNRKQLQKEKTLKEGTLSEQPTMRTSNIYPQTSEVENQTRADFEGLSQDGFGLGLSGADGNSVGGASIGDVSGLSGVALSPPHPVTGVRTSATHVRDGLGGTTPLRPGKTTTRGFGDNPPLYTMGSCLWFFDADHDNGAGQPLGKWCNLEWSNFEGDTKDKWGFWDTVKEGQFAGVSFFNTDLSQHPCGDVGNLISGINFGDNGKIGPAKNVLITQRGIGEINYDGPITPGKLFGLSDQGYNYLDGRSRKRKRGLVGGPIYRISGGGSYPTTGGTTTFTTGGSRLRSAQPVADPTTTTQTQQSSPPPEVPTPPIPPTPPTPPSSLPPSSPPPSSPPSESEREPIGFSPKTGTLTKWMSRDDFRKMFPDAIMGEFINGEYVDDYLRALPYGSTDFMSPNPNFARAWDLNNEAYLNFILTGDLSGLGNSSGIPKPRHERTSDPDIDQQKTELLNKQQSELNNLKGKNLATKIDGALTFLKNALGAASPLVKIITSIPVGDYGGEILTSMVLNEPIYQGDNDVPLKDKMSYVKGIPPTFFFDQSYSSNNIPSSNTEQPYSDENFYKDPTTGKIKAHTAETRKLYPDNTTTFSDKNPLDLFGVTNPIAVRGNMHTQIVEPEGGEPYIKVHDFAYLNKAKINDRGELQTGVQSKIAQFISPLLDKFHGRKEGSQNHGGMTGYPPNINGVSEMEFKVPYSQWTDKQKEAYNKSRQKNESYISESAKLGHFEPDILDVDIEDIRKGIMPEFPEKPPAEMVDGYHQDSKLKPKKLNKELYLKIDEKDLIRNHRLKPDEAREMMQTIERINDHIKKHPEDLIHAQMRYPIDDPRLAELNWKMDQMLEAGDEYLDKNFKENSKLFKRAIDRTKNNIKLTDPKYAQQRYDELRGTTKPKKTNLVGRLGKHLNKYESKGVLRHVDSDDFKKINELKIERKEQVKKIQEQAKEMQKEIKIEFQEKKNDWRKDLGNNTY